MTKSHSGLPSSGQPLRTRPLAVYFCGPQDHGDRLPANCERASSHRRHININAFEVDQVKAHLGIGGVERLFRQGDVFQFVAGFNDLFGCRVNRDDAEDDTVVFQTERAMTMGRL